MSLKISTFLLLAGSALAFAQEAAISCNFMDRSPAYPYTCMMTINNPDGRDDFEAIAGDHVGDFTDADVIAVDIFLQNTRNIPSVICRQFANLEQLTVMLSDLEVIDESAFAICGGSLRTVTLSFNNITEIPANTFRNNANLRFIHISNNAITTVDNSAFAGSAAALINLEFNSLDAFNPAPFEAVNETLSSLGIFANQITALPSRGFVNLRHLQWLDLTGNQLASVPDDAFVGLERLELLYAIECGLSEPRSAWFDAMPRLEELHLELNEIGALASGVFNGLRRLTNLYLGHNNLTQLTSEPFGGSVLNVEILSLVRNGLFAIDEQFMRDAENLDSLELSGNVCSNANHFGIIDDRSGTQARLRRCFDNFGPEFIRCEFGSVGGDYSCELTVRNPHGIDFETIEGEHLADRDDSDVVAVRAYEANTRVVPRVVCRQFVQLRTLSIVASYVEELTPTSFEACEALEQLDLSYNLIRAIPDGSFRNAHVLREVTLRDNYISRLAGESFSGSAIQSLDLAVNELFELDPRWFEPVNATLRSLNMAHNRVALLYNDSFANLRGLEELVLNGNLLYIIPANAFESLVNVQTLGLSDCGIAALNAHWFRSLASLRQLQLAANDYADFPDGVFAPLVSLQALYFYASRVVELRAASFGASLDTVSLLFGTQNLINVFDPAILERAAALNDIFISENLCVEEDFYGIGGDRERARNGLRQCIENFEAEQRISCEFALNEFDESYGCALTVVGPGRNVDFARVEGGHVAGRGDADVTSIVATDQNVLTVPSVLCSQFANLESLEITGSFVNTLVFGSFGSCSSLTTFVGSSNTISTVPAMVFSGARNLTRLELAHNRIRVVSASAFYGTQLGLLDLSGNAIDVFDAAVFSMVGPTLRTLRLAGNFIRHLPMGAFAGTPNLLELDLSNNRLQTIPGDAFAPLAGLEVLVLANCDIGRLDERWFERLDSLLYLQLAANRIDHLPENVFDRPALENLGLADNRLRVLDASSFGRSLERLFHVDASRNHIAAFDPLLLDNAASLFALELERNVCIDNTFLEIPFYREYVREYFADCFARFDDVAASCQFWEDEAQYQCDLTLRNAVERMRFERIEGEHLDNRNDNYVTHVFAQGNPTRSIPTLLCQQFQYIESFSVVDSEVEWISRETFRNCEFLYSINLASNLIEVIPDGAFSNNVYLSALNLASNRIATISPGMFQGAQIYYLDIENNHLSVFDPSAFAPVFDTLFYLFMRTNRFSSFPRSAFTSFANLRTLDLNNNRLDFLPSNAFRGLSSLNRLELANCALGSLNYRWFDDLLNLTILEVDLNGVRDLPPAVFDLPNLLQLGIAANRVEELSAVAFGRSLASLVSLRAEDNAIDAIDPAILDNATDLQTLTLVGNVCANTDFGEVQANIDTVRDYLGGCFANFRA